MSIGRSSECLLGPRRGATYPPAHPVHGPFGTGTWEPARFGYRGQVNRKQHVTRNRNMDNDQVPPFDSAYKSRASQRVMRDNSSSRAPLPPLSAYPLLSIYHYGFITCSIDRHLRNGPKPFPR